MIHRGRPKIARPVDMVEVWANACAELHVIKTQKDCDRCPQRKQCQKEADRLAAKLIDTRHNHQAKSAGRLK